jgi:hypothetical protein
MCGHTALCSSLQVRQHLRSAKWLSYTVDLWTSISNRCFVGLTVHWIDETWDLKSMCLGIGRLAGSHAAGPIASWLKEKFTDFGIVDLVWCGVCDGAGNVVNSVVDELKHEHHFCFCHLTNLVCHTTCKVSLCMPAHLLTFTLCFLADKVRGGAHQGSRLDKDPALLVAAAGGV